jgi:methenyltetrahydrofolate cyclohydrolase
MRSRLPYHACESGRVPDLAPSLLDMTVRELLEAAAERTPAPGGGASAALTTALAAALSGMAARFGDGAERAAERADALRAEVTPLADADAAAYRAYLAATRLPRDDPGRAGAIAAARRETIAVPARIAELAGAVAELAADLARSGNPNLRGDAGAAVHLAAAAASAAAELIAENVADDAGAAERDRARGIGAAARRLAEAVVRQ